MKIKSKHLNINLNFKKLKIADYNQFSTLFTLSFKKKISYEFYKWRYFSDKKSFCYGIFDSSKLIACVGMKSYILNNKKRELIFSRHSSMVNKSYRGKGLFSQLLKIVKKKFLKNTKLILMWPNQNNFSNFSISKKKILSRKFYLHRSLNVKIAKKVTTNLKIDQIYKFKKYIKNNNNFYFKDLTYFKNRYLRYKQYEYSINKFIFKNCQSFFVLKKNKYKNRKNYIILDHFGDNSIKSKHLNQIIKDYKSIIFWSISKQNKPNLKILSSINLNIGITKNIEKKVISSYLFKNEFMPGDTDSFISLK